MKTKEKFEDREDTVEGNDLTRLDDLEHAVVSEMNRANDLECQFLNFKEKVNEELSSYEEKFEDMEDAVEEIMKTEGKFEDRKDTVDGSMKTEEKFEDREDVVEGIADANIDAVKEALVGLMNQVERIEEKIEMNNREETRNYKTHDDNYSTLRKEYGVASFRQAIMFAWLLLVSAMMVFKLI